MIRRLIRPLQIILPPTWTVVVFLLCYLVPQGLIWFFQSTFPDSGDPSDRAIVEPLWRMRTAIATAGAVAFALWRVLGRHPIVRWDYRQWLAQTPWTPDQPLPMGKVSPGAVDVPVVALTCWLAGSDIPEGPISPVFGYLIAVNVATCLLAGLTGQRAVLYTLLFGLGLALRVGYDVLCPLVVLAAMLPLVYAGLRRSLEPARWPGFSLSLEKYKEMQQRSWVQLGWPFGFVGPRASPRYLRRIDALAIALLLGWFAHSGFSVAGMNRNDEQALVAGGSMLIATASVLRAIGFCVRFWSPISLLGRILTFRWIIPPYDRVFIAPLTAILALVLGQFTISAFKIPAPLGQPAVVSVCALILLAVGPSVRNWELTGGHRITSLFYCNKGSQFIRV